MEREVDLHHRERHVGERPAGRGWDHLRRRSHHVSAQLSGAVAARDVRGRARAWIFSVDPDGQFRMVGRI